MYNFETLHKTRERILLRNMTCVDAVKYVAQGAFMVDPKDNPINDCPCDVELPHVLSATWTKTSLFKLIRWRP